MSPHDELEGTEQPFVSHLIELRDRLLRSVYGLLAAVLVLMVFPGPGTLIDWLAIPIRSHLPPNAQLIATGVFSPLMVPLKVVLMAAVLVVLPWLIYQASSMTRPTRFHP
jgi:sec-independent protein translocase protein TatC